MKDEFVIRSKVFSEYPEIRFGMSTRLGGVSLEPFGMNLSFSVGDEMQNVQSNRGRFFGELDIPVDRLAIPRQVHSATVRRVSSPGVYEACDALMTNQEELYLTVSIADCLPIFMYDPRNRAIAAVHSGWRGSKEAILKKAVQGMRTEFGTNPADLVVHVGASARVCCYEVGDEVAEQFTPKFIRRSNGRKPHLDLLSYNCSILTDHAVPAERIEVSPYCTICNPELFHSCRRDGTKSGRMSGVIGIKPISRDS